MIEKILRNEEDTIELGKAISEKLRPGSVLALTGDLGAGKTTLSRSICSSLGIEDVTSPTYTIVNEYEGDYPVFHFDAYRLTNAEALWDIGFDDYIDRNGIIIIEWADIVADALPDDTIWVEMHYHAQGRMALIKGMEI